MYTRVFVAAVVAVASAVWHVQVDAAACAAICYTTELTGFGPGGSAGCSCSGQRQGARAGGGGCSCGQCYTMSGSGIIGYAISSDGTCTFGTDCGDCDFSPDGTSTTSPPAASASPTSSPSATEPPSSSTPIPEMPPTVAPTASPETNSSSTFPPSSVAPSSDSSNTHAGDTIGSVSPDTATSSNSLETWQIALIICCGVLVFTVAVAAVLSCYCKARNRLYENEDDQADANYYQQSHPRFRESAFGAGVTATPALYPGPAFSTCRSGSSSSLTNELKPMYANSANSGSSDRLMVGLAPVRSRHSTSDVARSSGSFSQERILSGSYPTDLRPSFSNRSLGRCPSFEHRYNTARERELLAVDL